MSFSLKYNLEDAGWATFQLEDGDINLNVTVSYLHDSLREMGEAALSLYGGYETAQIVFMDEPGEHHFILNRRGDAIHYEVRWFDHWHSWGFSPDGDSKVVGSGVTTVGVFVGEVRGELERVFRENGMAGYKQKWVEHGFPLVLLKRLRWLRLAF